MMSGPNSLALPYIPQDGTEDDLLHDLSGTEVILSFPRFSLQPFLYMGIILANFQSAASQHG